jgi:hypothetical protein
MAVSGEETVFVPYDKLLLDPENPRLAGLGIQVGDQDSIIAWLWKNMAVDELVDSMAASGYWQHEVLFATEDNDKKVVIEGNRRLAAVKVLLNPSLRRRLRIGSVPEVEGVLRKTIEKLPVLFCSRKELWRYVGFKHVNGPQTWDSIAKAEYIFRVRTQYKVDIGAIASMIGDRHETVKRLYRGFVVLKQAEDEGLFHREDRHHSRFYFSHLWTGLGYSGIQKFLGLTQKRMEKPNPVPKNKRENLQELMLWLYGSKQSKLKPKIHSQNPDLRNLDEVLRTPRGLAFLRKPNQPLSLALEASQGDERLLENALVGAETQLREAKRFVATGFSGQEHLRDIARDIGRLSESLNAEMSDYEAPRKTGIRKRPSSRS